MKTGENGSAGTIAFDYQQYLKDAINNNTIRVPGIGEGTEADEIVYDLDISEVEIKMDKKGNIRLKMEQQLS